MIRQATQADIPAIKKIADKNKDSIGFVMRSALEGSIQKQWLLVAEDGDEITGFCNYRHCRNGRTTIYEICIDASRRRSGSGRDLLRALIQDAHIHNQTYINLKCVIGLPANLFYEAMGFTLVGSEPGKKRALNIWRMELQPCLM